MGNCQTVDAASLVIQHPNGKQERMYSPVTASEVMQMNPGHYVSLIIPSPITGEENADENPVRYMRVELLRSSETLVLGRAYRLVTTQEVMKVLRAKKRAKMKKKLSESTANLKMDLPNSQSSGCGSEAGKSAPEQNDQVLAIMGHDRNQLRSGSTNLVAAKSKSWQPSLRSISESGNSIG